MEGESYDNIGKNLKAKIDPFVDQYNTDSFTFI
jgi:hypothetical protein